MENLENKITNEPKENLENGFVCQEVKIIGNEQEFLTDYKNGKIMRFVYSEGILYLGSEHQEIYNHDKGNDKIKPKIDPHNALDGYFGLTPINKDDWLDMDYLGYYRCINNGITAMLCESKSGKYLKGLKESFNISKKQVIESINQYICDFLGQPDYVHNKF